MNKIGKNVITGANIYIEGNSYLGRAEEIKLPDIVSIAVERKNLGMIGKTEDFYGFDKLEGEIKWNSYYPEVAKMVANPYKFCLLQARASVMIIGATGREREVPMVTEMLVQFKKNPAGTLKHLEQPEFPSEYSCKSIKQLFDGEEVLMLDIQNNIWRVDGQDMLADYNANIGG